MWFMQYKGKKKEDLAFPFWDLVVLTTGDEEQKQAYELQVKWKKQCGEIPCDIDVCVFSDPPGTRAGTFLFL